MNKLLQLAALTILSIVSYAQVAPEVDIKSWCHSHSKTEEIRSKSPELQKQYAEYLAGEQRFYNDVYKKDKSQQGVVKVIPVVFHVIHDYGIENLSDAQIIAAVDNMNKDYRKLKADTANIVAPFNLYHPDTEIEFRLAQIDPNGGCTNGIVRKQSLLTYSADDDVKKASTGGSEGWPNDMYLNIWTAKNLASGAGGYSYLPPIDDWRDGIVIRADQLGSLTHEAGHWMGLPHPWGFTNDPCVAANCSSDDGITDTPINQGACGGCNTSTTTCLTDPDPFYSYNGTMVWSGSQIKDNAQNYMDYFFCSAENFTEGQMAKMQATLNSTVNGRNNLWIASNRLATGTNDGFVNPGCAPVADFINYGTGGCPGTTVNFEDKSYQGTITSRQWIFDNGNPNTSTSATPSITYTIPGNHNVTLIVGNANGYDTIVKTGLISITNNAGGETAPFFYSVENSTFPDHPTDTLKSWRIENESTETWTRTTTASSDGSASARIKCFGIPSGKIHGLITPFLDFSNMTSVNLSFDVAYAQRSSSTSDNLKVYLSTNCGESWLPRWSKSGSSLSSTGTYITTAFVPNATQWDSYTINLSNWAGLQGILIKFELTSGLGNYLYLDKINFNGNVVGLSESFDEESVLIYPNPSSNDASILLTSQGEKSAQIDIYDLVGKNVGSKTIKTNVGQTNIEISSIANLEKGVYNIKITMEDASVVKRFIKL